MTQVHDPALGIVESHTAGLSPLHCKSKVLRDFHPHTGTKACISLPLALCTLTEALFLSHENELFLEHCFCRTILTASCKGHYSAHSNLLKLAA